MKYEDDPETFTLDEMREAYIKYVGGRPLTEKERWLAEAKANAVRSMTKSLYDD